MLRIVKAIINIPHDLINPAGKEIKKRDLTYLSKGALFNIYSSIRSIEKKQIPGVLIEAGCALGGSAIMIGLTKSPFRKLQIYDVFGMIPPPSEKDGADVHERYQTIREGKSEGIGDKIYYGYEQNLLKKVKQNLGEFGLSEKDNIEFIQGKFEDTMKLDEPVAFAHIDCDWYESVNTCLERIVPKLSENGILIIDDYFNWSGCTRAVDEFFNQNGNKRNFQFKSKHERLVIIKIDNGNPS